jgi:uncharacterized membrane protein YedE/YeeE
MELAMPTLDLEINEKVALLAFLLGLLFGAIGQRTNFCTMGAVSDWVNMGDKNRLRAWLLAIGVAILATGYLQWSGPIDLQQSIYLTPNFGWLGHLLGGLLFGIGMTLASGCGQRTLVRIGGGNLKSLVVLLVLGITAYMTLRGLLALVRVDLIELANKDLTTLGLAGQGLPDMLGRLAGIDDLRMLSLAVAVALGGGLVAYSFASVPFRRSFDDILAGIAIGLIVAAGWYATGVAGFDDFEPTRLESFTFVAPTGESLMYLMTFTGSTIGFGVAAVFGVILGSFLYAVLSGRFRIEAFASTGDLARHLVGAVLMGFGGVLSLGCTIGQGVTGMSTLAAGSLLTLVSIVFGSALTMKTEFYLLDGVGVLRALRLALSDMHLAPRPGDNEAS